MTKADIVEGVYARLGSYSLREAAAIRQHTYWTFSVLDTIGGLNQVAEWAAFHHERLDGAGYPFHLRGDRLNSGARIMAVADIFTAIIEDRPYRAGMSKEQAVQVMAQQADRKLLDPNVIQLLLDSFDEVASRVRDKQAVSRAFYEQQFMQAA